MQYFDCSLIQPLFHCFLIIIGCCCNRHGVLEENWATISGSHRVFSKGLMKGQRWRLFSRNITLYQAGRKQYRCIRKDPFDVIAIWTFRTRFFPLVWFSLEFIYWRWYPFLGNKCKMVLLKEKENIFWIDWR